MRVFLCGGRDGAQKMEVNKSEVSGTRPYYYFQNGVIKKIE